MTLHTIRQLRTAKGWTQEDLAEQVDVTPNTIHNWEKSNSTPRIAQLRDLARVFGVRIDEIELMDVSAASKPAVD